jgi:hypothetical protein
MRLPAAAVGPEVDVTIPLKVSERFITCLEWVRDGSMLRYETSILSKLIRTTEHYMEEFRCYCKLMGDTRYGGQCSRFWSGNRERGVCDRKGGIQRGGMNRGRGESGGALSCSAGASGVGGDERREHQRTVIKSSFEKTWLSPLRQRAH